MDVGQLPGRNVESWLRREAMEADDLLSWQRLMRVRQEPLLVLRQLAGVQRMLLEDVRCRAEKQLEHEAADIPPELVVQLIRRQFVG